MPRRQIYETMPRSCIQIDTTRSRWFWIRQTFTRAAHRLVYNQVRGSIRSPYSGILKLFQIIEPRQQARSRERASHQANPNDCRNRFRKRRFWDPYHSRLWSGSNFWSCHACIYCCCRTHGRSIQTYLHADSIGNSFVPSITTLEHCTNNDFYSERIVIIDIDLMARTGALRFLLHALGEGPLDLAPILAAIFLHIVDSPRTRAYLSVGIDLEVSLVEAIYTAMRSNQRLSYRSHFRQSRMLMERDLIMLTAWKLAPESSNWCCVHGAVSRFHRITQFKPWHATRSDVFLHERYGSDSIPGRHAPYTISRVTRQYLPKSNHNCCLMSEITQEIILDMFFDLLNIKTPAWFQTFIDGRRLTSMPSSVMFLNPAPKSLPFT